MVEVDEEIGSVTDLDPVFSAAKVSEPNVLIAHKYDAPTFLAFSEVLDRLRRTPAWNVCHFAVCTDGSYDVTLDLEYLLDAKAPTDAAIAICALRSATAILPGCKLNSDWMLSKLGGNRDLHTIARAFDAAKSAAYHTLLAYSYYMVHGVVNHMVDTFLDVVPKVFRVFDRNWIASLCTSTTSPLRAMVACNMLKYIGRLPAELSITTILLNVIDDLRPWNSYIHAEFMMLQADLCLMIDAVRLRPIACKESADMRRALDAIPDALAYAIGYLVGRAAKLSISATRALAIVGTDMHSFRQGQFDGTHDTWDGVLLISARDRYAAATVVQSVRDLRFVGA